MSTTVENFVVNAVARRLERWLRVAVVAGLLFVLADPANVHGAMVYVYKNARGSVLITDHPRVKTGYTLVKRYGTDAHDEASNATRTFSSAFDAMIDTAARANGLDSALVRAVIHAESAFDPGAVSHKGAVGLMQLMKATARVYGVSDRYDPWQNLSAGTRHLRRLLDRHGDTALALAAYNAGSNAVTRYRGIPPYPETKSYVEKVLRLHALYRQQG
ncbi:MAG: lytic transglycosylase domain-containing protein [Proteobacteria bacterium]|nr:MAG: lytic transglycosylase domain-containing protein [Pseudomonadota bacterium]